MIKWEGSHSYTSTVEAFCATCSLNNIFDVVCMSETWLSGSTDDQVNIAGFTFVGENRGAGVGMYLKNDLKYKIKTDIYSNNENTCELIAIEIVNEYSKNITDYCI